MAETKNKAVKEKVLYYGPTIPGVAIENTMYSEMPDIDSYISDYMSFTFKQDLSVDGFYRFMIEYNNDYYLEHLQDSYDSLDD